MNTYRVTYTVDLEAESAEDAAHRAGCQLAFSGKSEGITPYALRAVYEVAAFEAGPEGTTSVDLDEIWGSDTATMPPQYETVDARQLDCAIIEKGFTAFDYHLSADYALSIPLDSTRGFVMIEGTHADLRRALLEMIEELDREYEGG